MKYGSQAFALVAGVGALWVPLLCDFHVESASVASAFACISVAWQLGNPQKTLKEALVRSGTGLFLFAIPILLFSLWKGCITADGLLFWLIYPVTGLLFGAGLATAVRSRNFRNPRWMIFFLLLWIAVGVWLIEFFTLPQVRFFNHIWGHFPGPVYDDEVRFTQADLYFRGMTLAWSVVFFLFAQRKRKEWMSFMLLALLAWLAFGYTNLGGRGIVSTRSYIQQSLGGAYSSRHFQVYYDSTAFSEDEIRQWTHLQELYRLHILDVLDLNPEEAMLYTESYLYKHVWQKKKLTGAKYTSYVPVWNRTDQIHVSKEALPGTLHHELVHVAAKAFGNGLFHASWNFGLIEGIAVAVVPDVSAESTIDQLVAAAPKRPDIDDLKRTMSFEGFYTGRGGVNYTVAGSFVRWLLQHYPAEYVREAYRTASFSAFPVSFDELAQEWLHHIEQIETDVSDRIISGQIFNRLSLFEKDCPRLITQFYRHYDSGLMFSRERNHLSAYNEFFQAGALDASVYELAAREALFAGMPELLNEIPDLADASQRLLVYKADAAMMSGDTLTARTLLAKIISTTPDSIRNTSVLWRSETADWRTLLSLNYNQPEKLPDPKSLHPQWVSVWIQRNGISPHSTIPDHPAKWISAEYLSVHDAETLALALLSQQRTSEASALLNIISVDSTKYRYVERVDLLRHLILLQ